MKIYNMGIIKIVAIITRRYPKYKEGKSEKK